MNTNLSVKQIQLAIYNSKIWNTRTDIFIPNVSFGLLEYEADLIIMSNTGYLTEIEIKRSIEDLKADFKKKHTHNDEKIYRFFYCIPESIKINAIELFKEKNINPAILIYDETGIITRCGGFSEKGGRKLFIEEQLKLAKLGCFRFWNLLNKKTPEIE